MLLFVMLPEVSRNFMKAEKLLQSLTLILERNDYVSTSLSRITALSRALL